MSKLIHENLRDVRVETEAGDLVPLLDHAGEQFSDLIKAICANTMTDLMTDGLIDYPDPQPGYPWSRARVTEAGLKLLEQSA